MLERIIGERQYKDEKEETAREKIKTQYSIREDMKHSVRILLAEDNPVNQKLARIILHKAGYQVEVVDNGRAAVEKYTTSPENFDLIFMDVQMPEMDGMEATNAIRRFEEQLRVTSYGLRAGNGITGESSPGNRNSQLETRNPQLATRRIPIVAMTANAMKGDKEECLESGMDDYIAKPIKREFVLDILDKWVFDRKSL
jgi:CheY-like chemotaxis protein